MGSIINAGPILFASSSNIPISLFHFTPSNKLLVHTCTIFNNRHFQTTRQSSPHWVDTTTIYHFSNRTSSLSLFSSMEEFCTYLVYHFADRIHIHRLDRIGSMNLKKRCFASNQPTHVNRQLCYHVGQQTRTHFFFTIETRQMILPNQILLLHIHAGTVHNFLQAWIRPLLATSYSSHEEIFPQHHVHTPIKRSRRTTTFESTMRIDRQIVTSS